MRSKEQLINEPGLRNHKCLVSHLFHSTCCNHLWSLIFKATFNSAYAKLIHYPTLSCVPIAYFDQFGHGAKFHHHHQLSSIVKLSSSAMGQPCTSPVRNQSKSDGRLNSSVSLPTSLPLLWCDSPTQSGSSQPDCPEVQKSDTFQFFIGNAAECWASATLATFKP